MLHISGHYLKRSSAPLVGIHRYFIARSEQRIPQTTYGFAIAWMLLAGSELPSRPTRNVRDTWLSQRWREISGGFAAKLTLSSRAAFRVNRPRPYPLRSRRRGRTPALPPPLSRAGVLGGVTAGAVVLSCGVQVKSSMKELMMRVFLAGATGAIGKQLVPRLVEAGHEVHGMTRSESKQAMLHELGAVPVVADALDPDQVAEAVGRARPDVIVHQLTAIGAVDLRHFDRDFALTNRLRTEGTDHLLSAGQAVGVRRFVAQGVGGYGAYARTGGPVKTEEDPLDPTPARGMRETLAAIRHLEEAVLGARWTEGIVLRYGVFYGPGTSLAPGEEQFELVRRRKFPLVGDGGGVWSFIHVADAAEATVAAVERGSRGVYNVVDDDPAPVAKWLPALAQELGAKKPMRVPRFIGRLFAGEAGVVMMTDVRGASNAKAKRELGWRPAHPSWRDGFAAA